MATEVYISFDEFCEQTREPYSDDEWDRGDTHTEIYFNNARLTNVGNESFTSTEPLSKGDKIYIVWGHWGSGCTFGHDSGSYAEIFEVTKDREFAYRLSEFLGKQADYGFKEFEGKVYYIPWSGYFDSFEGMHVEETTLDE